jgi:hypothetical protein
MFIPKTTGTILPTGSAVGGVSLNLVVNVDSRSDAATVRQAVMAAAGMAQAQMARGMRIGR